MQAEHNKFVPRPRAFEGINSAAYDRFKDEWECDPSSMAKCTDAKQQIWEIVWIWENLLQVTDRHEARCRLQQQSFTVITSTTVSGKTGFSL